jgi:Leucine-rich repeat (LRR) protein
MEEINRRIQNMTDNKLSLSCMDITNEILNQIEFPSNLQKLSLDYNKISDISNVKYYG